MLRDDGEALRNRLDAMERELSEAVNELTELRPKAEKLDRAEAGIAEREKEIAELRAKLEPGRRSALGLAATVLVLSLVVLGGLVFWYERVLENERETAAMERASLTNDLAGLQTAHAAELAALQAQVDEAQALARGSEDQRASAQRELERERMIEGQLRREHSFVARTLASRRVRVTGRSDLGSSCTVALSPNEGECRARVTCGSVEIYPAPGHGGYFSCDVEDGHLVRGADVNPTPVSGDPTLDVDGHAGIVTVTDASPAWSARIDIEPL